MDIFWNYIFHIRDIRENVLPKFTKLCMETQCCCHFGAQIYMATRKQQKPNLSFSSPTGVNTSSEEPIKVKVIFILRDARSSKNR